MFWEEWRSLALIIDRISFFKRLSLKRESVFYQCLYPAS